MSKISYHDIYHSWLMIDLKHNKHAIIHADRFITSLHISNIISKSEMENVKHEIANEDKNRKLFLEILPSKGKTGLEKMIEIMTNNYDSELLNYFEEARGNLATLVKMKTRQDDGRTNETDSLLLGVEIGSGGFATVHVGQYKNKKRAIKKFYSYNQVNVTALKKEFHIISPLKEHPNIVSYIDIYDDNTNKTLYLIMELVDGYTLERYCNPDEKTKHLDLEKKLWISKCCWTGLEYLHQNQIIHGDISPKNILVSLNSAIVKICDFGMSKFKDIMMDTTNSEHRNGTKWYRAPELLQGRRHPIFSDVFSMAATQCEFFSETHFMNVKNYEQLVLIWAQQLANDGLASEPDCFSKIPESVQGILSDAVSPHYKNRPTASTLLERTIIALNKANVDNLGPWTDPIK